ncbi:MAG: MFS transporter [Burkholderiales bacterium]|nr:MFS transporter [Burkholderiales bacterium]
MAIHLVVLMAFLSQAGFGGSRVAVSLHALALTDNQFAIGLVIALYSLCPMLLAIAIGRFADRTSPRMMVTLGSLALTAALLLPASLPGFGALCAAALVLGFSHQVFSLPVEATVGGIGGPDKRARNYTLITMGWSAANFLGPVLAGYSIDHLGQGEAYLILAALTLAPVLVIAVKPDVLPARVTEHARAEPRGGVMELWRVPALRSTIIAVGVVGTAQDLFQFYLPIYGHAVGLSASAIGTVLGVSFLAAFLIRAVLPWLARRTTEAAILHAAIFVSAAAFVLFPFFESAWALCAIAFLLGLGVGCSYPMAMSLLYVIAPPERLAEAFGLQKTVRNATHLVVPLFFGSVGTAFGYVAVFLTNAAILATGGFLLRRSGMPRPKPARATGNP